MSVSAFAQEADEPDFIELASMLVRDGHYERAARELQKVDTSNGADIDRATYHTLSGLIALERRVYQAAVDQFDEAIRHGKTDDIIFVYLAQAYFHLGDWERTVLSIRNAEGAGEEIPDLYLMKAHAHRRLGQYPEAWAALQAGGERFAGRAEFLRRKVFLLVEMGLYQEAAGLGQTFLESDETGVGDYLALGEAFRRAGAPDRAQLLLEEARIRYPGEPRVVVHLAHAYLGDDKLLAAAELMQRAARYDKKYVQESAELYRRAGALERALFMNARIDDPEAKFRQRTAILLDQKRFEELALLEGRLDRLGLLADQKLLYTLAYARFKNGDFEHAERLLTQISDAQLFESAVQLRRTVQLCQQEPSKC